MTLLLVYIAIAIGVSFLCSLLEASLLSVTPTFVAQFEAERPALGRALRELKEDVDRPLAAILSLNTLAHTIGAAGAGAEAQRLWGNEILTLASAVLTMLILVFSELIPKTLGAVYWKRFVPMSARVLPPLIFMTTPLVLLSDLITLALKKGRTHAPKISRDEIAALATLAEEDGTLEPNESRILRSLVQCGSLTVHDIMTPRTVIFFVRESDTIGEIVDMPEAEIFSRFPVVKDGLDSIVGYALKSELLLRASRGERDTPVGELTREHLRIPDTLAVPVVFDRLLKTREQIAIVMDEHGGVDGLVTMEDVVETVLGMEIVDEADAVQDMREMARARWQERARRHQTIPPPSTDPPGTDTPSPG